MSKTKYLVLEINGEFEPCIEVEGKVYLLNEQKTKVKFNEKGVPSLKIKLKNVYKNVEEELEEEIYDTSVPFKNLEEETVDEDVEKIEEKIFLKFFPETQRVALHDEDLQTRDAEIDIVYSKNEDGFQLYDYTIEWKENLFKDFIESNKELITFEVNNKVYELEDAVLPNAKVKVIKSSEDYIFVEILEDKVVVHQTNQKINVKLGSVDLEDYLNQESGLTDRIGMFLLARENDKLH